MAKIVGIKNFAYHIEASDGFPARDFDGYQVHFATPVFPGEGYGTETVVFPVSKTDFPTVFHGLDLEDVVLRIGMECGYELRPVGSAGKKYKLSYVNFVE